MAAVVVATLTLAGSVDTVTGSAGSVERATFATNFKADVAALIDGVEPSQITITSIAAGSVVVTFEISGAVDPSAVTAAFSQSVVLTNVGVSTVGPATAVLVAAHTDVEAEPEAEAEVEPELSSPGRPEGESEPDIRERSNSWDASTDSEPEADVEPSVVFIWAPTGCMYVTFVMMVIGTYFRGVRLASGDFDVQTLFDPQRSEPSLFSTAWWDRRFMQRSAIMMSFTHDGRDAAPERISTTMRQHYGQLFPVIKRMLPGLVSAVVAPALMTWREQLSQLVFP